MTTKEEEREALARSIECRRCGAEMGDPCVNTTTRAVLPRAHQLRVIDAGGGVLPPGTRAPEIGEQLARAKQEAAEATSDVVRESVRAALDPALVRSVVTDALTGIVASAFGALTAPSKKEPQPFTIATPEGEMHVTDRCTDCGAALAVNMRGRRWEGVHEASCPKVKSGEAKASVK